VINLLPPHPNDYDWVYVERILGRTPGPLYRPPTVAEMRAAAQQGATRTWLSRLSGLSTSRLNVLLGPDDEHEAA
jgi:hypothetical protein